MTFLEFRYFTGHSKMDMVVVHPAYWRRGHGTALVRWGLDIADTDLVKQGVIAADMGAKLYLALGYSMITDVYAGSDEEAPDGITCTVSVLNAQVSRRLLYHAESDIRGCSSNLHDN